MTGAFILIVLQWPLGLKVYVRSYQCSYAPEKMQDSVAVEAGMTLSQTDNRTTKVVDSLGLSSAWQVEEAQDCCIVLVREVAFCSSTAM